MCRTRCGPQGDHCTKCTLPPFLELAVELAAEQAVGGWLLEDDTELLWKRRSQTNFNGMLLGFIQPEHLKCERLKPTTMKPESLKQDSLTPE